MPTSWTSTSSTAATGLILDNFFQLHETALGHPECPERVSALRAVLEARDLISRCCLLPLTAAGEELLLSNHSAEYIARLERACAGGLGYIDCSDSSVGERSAEVARCAAGSIAAAADMIAAGELKNAFCAVRPPGHHAEHGESMGFCLFNNAAIAARRLIDHHSLERVLILDWDVHHGNGTQHSFEDDPRVLYCSFHQHPRTLYPGTGMAEERGRGAGEGTTLNLPMMPGAGDEEYRRAYFEIFLPAAEAYRPQFVIISAGFDAHQADAISRISLTEDSFRWLSAETASLASRCCSGRLLSVLEGGYDLPALGASAAVHLEQLINAA